MSVSINGELSEQLKMLELLQLELNDYIDTTPTELWFDDTIRHDYFNDLVQKIDNLARAAELVGLLGFTFCCEFLAKNFMLLAVQPLDRLAQIEIARWPWELLAYLQAIVDKGFTESANHILSDYIAGVFWPSPLSFDAIKILKQHLNNAAFADNFIFNGDAQLPNPDTLTLAQASLNIPLDIRPELMTALLMELPKQSDIFSAALESFINSGNAEHLLAAQRMAHTIKGAANVVGVVGLSNLMHYAEDLLEKHLDKDVSTLLLYADLLLATADCLADITEYFQGFSAAPNNVMALLKTLLSTLLHENNSVDHERASVFEGEDFSASLFDDLDLFDAEGLAEVEASLGTKFVDDVDIESSVFKSVSFNVVDGERVNTDVNYAKQPFSLSITDEAATELLRAASEVKVSNFHLLSRVDAIKQFLNAAWSHQKKLKQLAQSFSDQPAAVESSVSDREFFNASLNALMADSDESLKDLELALQALSTVAVEQKTMVEDMHARVVNIRLLPASQLTTRCARAVRQISTATQKQAILMVEGGDILIDSRVLSSIIDPLLHLISNAIDHGLEHPSVRRQLGKPDEGNIKIIYERIGDALRITVQDDGAGIDYAELQRLAIKRGLLASGKNYSKKELHTILVAPGFSSRAQVTQSSGRGIGLDVVNAEVKELRGELNIHSVLGEGTGVVLTLPLSVLSAHLLVVSSQQYRLAIVSRGIEQIIYFKDGDLINDEALIAGAQTPCFILQGEAIPVYCLNDIYCFNTLNSPPVKHGALLIIKDVNGQRCGIAVEALVSGENYVIKPLGRYCYKPTGVVGAVVLGCGGVAPVVDLNDFSGMSEARASNDTIENAKTLTPKTSQTQFSHAKPLVLVVDDSLSVRQALTFLLTPLNCEIVFAKDGLDAITRFQERQPSLVITDLEMPRLNGFELARHIRREKDAFDVPIVMLSSRNTPKHRMLASKAGINTYLTKPWVDETILSTLQSLLPSLFGGDVTLLEGLEI